MTCKGFFPIITKPTRVTETSATIIDHIITNDLTRRLFPIILKTDLTDHYLTAVVATINIKRKQCQSGKILRGDMSHFSTENFNNDVEQFADRFLEDLTEITAENFNNVFDYFTNSYKRIVDQHAPIKCLSRKKQRLQNKPWISKGILISIRNKQKMYKTHFLQGSNVFKVIYKTYANKLTKVKSLAKKLYIARGLSKCKGDGCKMWEAVKTLIPSNSTKKSKATPSELRIDGSLIQNPKLMADEFCKHFTNIADSILDSLNLTSYTSDFKHYLPKRVTDSIFMQPTDLAEVFAAIMSLKSNKSCVIDYILTKIVKSSANIISKPLSQLINKAFLLGIFPGSLKIAKVVPIYKSGDKPNPSNYRAISLLTCFSKIFEKLIFTRINSFICKHSILAPPQYGFRKGCSTILQLLK